MARGMDTNRKCSVDVWGGGEHSGHTGGLWSQTARVESLVLTLTWLSALGQVTRCQFPIDETEMISASLIKMIK